MFPRYAGDTRPGPTRGETARLPVAETPCPSCASILDSLDGAASHLGQRVNLAVVAKSDPERNPHVRPGARVAEPAAAVLAQQQLQPRPPGRDPRRRPDPDPQRVRPRRE